MTNSKQRHGTRALLGPEDVNKLKLIYLKFQMSCSKILKKETLPVESFSICKLELTIFFLSVPLPQPLISLLPSNFEAAFSGHSSPPPAQDLCLSIEVNFFRYWGSSIYTLNQFFFLINLFVIRNDFFRYWGSSVHTSKLCVLKNKPVMCKVKCVWINISLFSDLS